MNSDVEDTTDEDADKVIAEIEGKVGGGGGGGVFFNIIYIFLLNNYFF